MLPINEAKAAVRSLPDAERYSRLIDEFARVFPAEERVVLVRAPGRLNMIGEHTDYNGLPVLPVAIHREITIACAPSDSPKIEITNLDPYFAPREFIASHDIPHYDEGDWGNYIKAGVQTACKWAVENGRRPEDLRGFKGVLMGNITRKAGLSSSSAMVVASATVTDLMNSLNIEKPFLADLLAHGERYVGTEGGGMDQAVSIMAQEGSALRIDFFPLRTKAVPIPKGYVVVVAHTMASAKKTGGAKWWFNTRVCECRLGLAMLKSVARKDFPAVKDAKLLSEFLAVVGDGTRYVNVLPDGPMSLADVAAFVGKDAAEVKETCLRQRDGGYLPIDEGFQPKRRCRHVLTESARVDLTVEAMNAGDAVRTGELMDESHTSCRDDYEISHPALETLVDTYREYGAVGARLTGAGFGGCAIALVKQELAQALMDGVWDHYYEAWAPVHRKEFRLHIPTSRNDVMFACIPSAGAGPLPHFG